MDSRLLFSATQTLKNKLIWESHNGEEWYHFGTELKEPFSLIKSQIRDHIGLNNVYIVTDRSDSRELTNNEIEAEINRLGGKKNFSLWDINLTKSIEFNKIGILRKGILNK